MKPLTNMQLALDIVIIANGLALAAWITSKALLNVIKASEIWVAIGAEERSESQTNEDNLLHKYREHIIKHNRV